MHWPLVLVLVSCRRELTDGTEVAKLATLAACLPSGWAAFPAICMSVVATKIAWVRMLGGFVCMALTSRVPWISDRDFFAASRPRHLVIAWSSVRSFTCRSSCIVSPSCNPSMI